jgi:hypothetical protein
MCQSRNLPRIKDSEQLRKLAFDIHIPEMCPFSLDRLGVFYFVPFLPEIELSPLDYPSLRAIGVKDVFEEYYALCGKPMTSEGMFRVAT